MTTTLLVFQPPTPTDDRPKRLQPTTPTPSESPTTATPYTLVQNCTAPHL